MTILVKHTFVGLTSSVVFITRLPTVIYILTNRSEVCLDLLAPTEKPASKWKINIHCLKYLGLITNVRAHVQRKQGRIKFKLKNSFLLTKQLWLVVLLRDMPTLQSVCRVMEGAFPRSAYRGLLHLGEEPKMMMSEASLPGCTTWLLREVVQILPRGLTAI